MIAQFTSSDSVTCVELISKRARRSGVPLFALFGASGAEWVTVDLPEQCEGWQPRGALRGDGRAEVRSVKPQLHTQREM